MKKTNINFFIIMSILFVATLAFSLYNVSVPAQVVILTAYTILVISMAHVVFKHPQRIARTMRLVDANKLQLALLAIILWWGSPVAILYLAKVPYYPYLALVLFSIITLTVIDLRTGYELEQQATYNNEPTDEEIIKMRNAGDDL